MAGSSFNITSIVQTLSAITPKSSPQTSSLRQKAQNKANPPTYVFPSDLRNAASDFPMMMISIYQYPVNSEKLLKDLEGESSQFDSSQSTSTNKQNTNQSFVKNIDGINAAKGTLISTIGLPMTNNIINAINVDWRMEDFAAGRAVLNGLGGVSQDINSFLGNPTEDATALNKAIFGTASDAFKSIAAATLSNALQKTLNVIANPKQQAFFYGVSPRHFQFDWAMTPQNTQEAQTIMSIIETITKYSLPSVADAGLLFNFPMLFEVTFQGGGVDNIKGWPQIDPCVCVGLVTNYTPNTLQLLNDGYPVQINFSMALLETTIRTQQRYGMRGEQDTVSTTQANTTPATPNTTTGKGTPIITVPI